MGENKMKKQTIKWEYQERRYNGQGILKDEYCSIKDFDNIFDMRVWLYNSGFLQSDHFSNVYSKEDICPLGFKRITLGRIITSSVTQTCQVK